MNDTDRRWLDRLRLDRDPFPETESASDFFSRGGRERQMELLIDTSTLGRPLIALIGESGIGKTTFFHALLDRLPSNAHVARITAGVFLSARALLQAVARAMGVEFEAETTVDALRRQLHVQMLSLEGAGAPCIILVDDAGELDAEALEELVQLAELARDGGHGIRVVLFSLPGVREALVRAAGEARVDELIHEMILDRYSLNELRGYLQFRLARAGLKGASPFSEVDYQEIFRRSSGLPGRANVVAGRMLKERRGGLRPNQIKWIAGGVAAALVLGAVLLMVLGDAPEPGIARTAPVPIPALLDGGNDAGSDRGMNREGNGAAAVQRVSVASGSNAADTDAAGNWLPLPASADGPEDTLSTPSAAASERSERSEREAPAAQGSASRAAPEIETEIAPGPTAAGAAPEAARSDAATLLAADPAHYTLQLLVSSTSARAASWIAARQRPEEFRQYRRTRDGAPQFVVVHGDFADRAAASRAADRISAETGVAAPWIRPLREIQGEIREQTQ